MELLEKVMAGVVAGGVIGIVLFLLLMTWGDPDWRRAHRQCEMYNADVRRGIVRNGRGDGPEYPRWWGVADHDGPEPFWCRVELAGGTPHAVVHGRSADVAR